MKIPIARIKKYACLATLVLMPPLATSGMSGFYSEECNEVEPAGFWLSRGFNAGPYVRFHSWEQKNAFSRNGIRYEDRHPSLQIVDDKTILEGEHQYHRCRDLEEFEFEPVDPADVQKYLAGKWKLISRITWGERKYKGNYIEWDWLEVTFDNSSYFWDGNWIHRTITSNSESEYIHKFRMDKDVINILRESQYQFLLKSLEPTRYRILGISETELYIGDYDAQSDTVRVYEKRE